MVCFPVVAAYRTSANVTMTARFDEYLATLCWSERDSGNTVGASRDDSALALRMKFAKFSRKCACIGKHFVGC